VAIAREAWTCSLSLLAKHQDQVAPGKAHLFEQWELAVHRVDQLIAALETARRFEDAIHALGVAWTDVDRLLDLLATGPNAGSGHMGAIWQQLRRQVAAVETVQGIAFGVLRGQVSDAIEGMLTAQNVFLEA